MNSDPTANAAIRIWRRIQPRPAFVRSSARSVQAVRKRFLAVSVRIAGENCLRGHDAPPANWPTIRRHRRGCSIPAGARRPPEVGEAPRHSVQVVRRDPRAARARRATGKQLSFARHRSEGLEIHNPGLKSRRWRYGDPAAQANWASRHSRTSRLGYILCSRGKNSGLPSRLVIILWSGIRLSSWLVTCHL